MADREPKRRRYNFYLREDAVEELRDLAHETRLSRSRFLERLIGEARPILERAAVIDRRRSWWKRLLGIGQDRRSLGPGL